MGRYWRSGPLVFSLEPLCQGECGSAKKMRMPVCAARPACLAISLPEVPTARESGFDIVTRIANYLAAPPGTPQDRLERLAAAARAAMSTPEIARALEAIAFVPVTDSTPERATRFIAEETALWGPVIRAANIEIE